MAPHSSTFAWKIPWMEEPGGLQSMGSRRVGHDWATSLSIFTFMHWRRQWQPTPVFLPGQSQGWGSLVGCRLWGRRVGHDWSDLAAAAEKFLLNPTFVLCVLFSKCVISVSLSLSLSLTHTYTQTLHYLMRKRGKIFRATATRGSLPEAYIPCLGRHSFLKDLN